MDFTHASMPVPEADLAQIKPMEPLRAAQFWKENISDMSPDAERLSSHDWPRKANSWSGETGWMAEWESDEPELPEALAAHLHGKMMSPCISVTRNTTCWRPNGQSLSAIGRTSCFTMMARFCLAAGVKKRSGSVAKAK